MERTGDVVTLRLNAKTTSNVQITSYSQKEAKQATNSGAEELPGMYKNSEGQTPLYLAATYSDCDNTQQKQQCNLVKRLLAWCPESLKQTDFEGLSPYLHRVAGSGKTPPEGDEITFFLKDQIMHLNDRDLVLDLLYGGPVSNPASLSP